MRVLPLTYPFRVTYASATQQISQNIASASTVRFQTENVTVELRDSSGALLPEADAVQYYSGGWRTFGAGTTVDGQVSTELLPKTYPFRLTYANATQQKSQNVASATTIGFRTTAVTVELRDSAGAPLGEADPVHYYSGGWHTFGTGSTSGGQATMELQPLNYPFRLTFAHASLQLSQNVSNDPLVVFQTRQAIDAVAGDLITLYYAGGWLSFIDGMELLPGTYPFRYLGGSQQSHGFVGGQINHVPGP